ncbi:ankyrin repeat domain-containing protein [Campylobacter hominis]|uniref:ankyrin repeat domain-containing protein n=1 Tax=Campylobacter hominis TaxID=76517 RepID=UPI00248C085B|nr:ankyrin repeat domain-containing protein [Campylobacter hominis]
MKDNNISVDYRLYGGVTPLMYASFYDDDKTSKELLNLGANPNLKDSYNLSPLAYAIENNSTKTFKLLLDNGAIFDEDMIVQNYLTIPCYASPENYCGNKQDNCLWHS